MNRNQIALRVNKIIDKVLEDMSGPDSLYERREGQINIMYTAIDAFEQSRNKIIEAGVGIGKSFGYLIPGVLFSYFTGKPLIIATSTIQLTEQLSKDVEVVEKLIDPYLSGRRVDYVVGKGSTHYPCICTIQNKLARTGNNEYLNILKKVGPGVDRQNPNGIEQKYWNEITIHQCMDTDKFDRNNCYFYQMRKELLKKSIQIDIEKKFNPRVLIVNQDLLINHFKNIDRGKNPILPDDPCLLVIDEVHNLEEKTRKALTIKINQRRIYDTFDWAEHYHGNKEVKDRIKQLKHTFQSLFKDIEKYVKYTIRNNTEITVEDKITISTGNEEDCKTMLSIIKQLTVDFSLKYESEKNKSYLQRNFYEIITGLNETLYFVEAYGNLTTANVIWAEVNQNKKIEIYSCPANIGETLNKHIFRKSVPTLCTSATITMNEDITNPYEYINTNIGFSYFNGDWEYMESSPFDYNKSRLFIPDYLPKYTDRGTDNYYEIISQIIGEIYSGCEGGCTVLVTSKKDMIHISEKLSAIIDRPIYLDNGEMTPKQIISQLEENKGLILSAGSFWEGIDLKGELLTNLIIVKLPYPVPDPVIQNKIYRFGRDNVLLPEMISKLRQGTGRLIRTRTDIGVVSILDSRMIDLDYPYLNMIFESLPFKNRISTINELKEFQRSNSL